MTTPDESKDKLCPEWSGEGTGLPPVEHMRKVVGLFAALARGSRNAIPELTSDMTLEDGALACFAVSQLLMRRLVQVSGKSVEDVAAQLALEVG